MKEKWAGTGAAVVKGSVELLLYLPLVLIIAVYALPDLPAQGLYVITLALCYGAGYAACCFAGSVKVYQLWVLAVLIGSAQAYFMFGLSTSVFFSLPVAALCAYRGARFVLEDWQKLFPVGFYMIGLIVYFAVSVVFQFVQSFVSQMPLLLWGGIISLSITLLAVNHFNMKSEALSGNKEPVLAKTVVWQNRILVGCIVLATIIVVSYRKLQQAFLWLKDQLIAWIRALFGGGEQPAEQVQQAPSPPPPFELTGPTEPPYWLQWLEKAFMVVVGAVVAVAVLAIVYMAGVRLWRLLKQLYERLITLLNESGKRNPSTGYEDDVETLLKWNEFPGQLTSRFKRWLSGKHTVKWEHLQTNQERIRYLYRVWLLRARRGGYVAKRHLTPKETADDMQLWNPGESESPCGLVQLYEQARYGEQPIDGDAVHILKQTIEKRRN